MKQIVLRDSISKTPDFCPLAVNVAYETAQNIAKQAEAEFITKFMQSVIIDRKRRCVIPDRSFLKDAENKKLSFRASIIPFSGTGWYLIQDSEGLVSETGRYSCYEDARTRLIEEARDRMELETGEEWSTEKITDALITGSSPNGFTLTGGCCGCSNTERLDYIRIKPMHETRDPFRYACFCIVYVN